MAYYECAKTVTLTAGADLRNSIYDALTVNSSGQVVKAGATTAHVIGALAANPIGSADTTGMALQVAVIGGGGVLKMKAGAAVTAGQLIVPTAAAGRVAGVADLGSLAEDQVAIGVALDTAADGDVFSVLAQSFSAPEPVSKNVTMTAGADLTGAAAEALTINASGQVVKTSVATDVIIGVVAEEPAAAAVGTNVAVTPIGAGGKLTMKAGASITAGNLIVPSTSSGRVAGVANIAALAANQMSVGIALESATDGETFEALAMTIAGPTA